MGLTCHGLSRHMSSCQSLRAAAYCQRASTVPEPPRLYAYAPLKRACKLWHRKSRQEFISNGAHCSRSRTLVCSCMPKQQPDSTLKGDSAPAEVQWVHFVGIGGAGLSALALVALKKGWRVTGSDLEENSRTKALKAAGATILQGHAAANIGGGDSGGLPDAVLVTSAINGPNPEVEQAQKLGIKVLRRDEWLGWITEPYELLAVAGSHGKSTTSSMLALVMRSLGEDITAVIGAEVPQFPDGGNAIVGGSRRFILEADEYAGTFLGVSPTLAVVTNVEWEHVDLFPDEASVRALFRTFVQRIQPGGVLILCGDSVGARSLRDAFQGPSETLTSSLSSEGHIRAHWLDTGAGRSVITYGLAEDNDWRATALVPNPQGGTDYTVVHANRPLARVCLKVPGVHNVLNSLAVIVAVAALAQRDAAPAGGNSEAAQLRARAVAASQAGNALAAFQGVKRRFESVGKACGISVFEDYAHHPTEVRATLQAARQRFDQAPVWVVFQPHTFSRLAKLLPDFAPAFSAADRVIVSEVYAAREDNVFNVTGADLAAAIVGPPAIYVPKQEDIIERLKWELATKRQVGDDGEVVLLILGAGDIGGFGSRLLEALQQNASM